MKNKIQGFVKNVKNSGKSSPAFKKAQKYLANNGLPILFVLIFGSIGVYTLLRTRAATGNDLVVTNVTMNPAAPSAGQNVTFTATIKNEGTTATPSGTVVGVAFSIDGQTVTWNRSHTSSLAPGASVTLTANAGTSGTTWKATSGQHTLTATADDNNVITNEIDENNNIRNLPFTIGSTGNLYITPESTSILKDQNFTVSVRINPETQVDGVSATVTYDASKIQFVSMNASGTPFDIELGQQTGGSGKVNMERGTLSGGVGSDSLIAKITFKALAGSGSSTLQLDGNATMGGFYTNPSKTNATVNFSVPDTTPPSVSITSPSNGATLYTTKTISANATDGVGVTKVEFLVDGQIKNTDTSSPYSFGLNTTTLSNGTHTIQARAYDAAGNVGSSSTITVTVKNWREDINQDGVVNLLDFSMLASKYGQTGSNLGREDINQDGSVSLLDFSLLAAKYGK